jgi:hypothetical protein
MMKIITLFLLAIGCLYVNGVMLTLILRSCDLVKWGGFVIPFIVLVPSIFEGYLLYMLAYRWNVTQRIVKPQILRHILVVTWIGCLVMFVCMLWFEDFMFRQEHNFESSLYSAPLVHTYFMLRLLACYIVPILVGFGISFLYLYKYGKSEIIDSIS